MDPLSVAASIVGLLAAGGKVTSLLHTAITKWEDSPALARSITTEVADISAALHQLQNFISRRTVAAPERGNLILVDQLLTTLTGCVTTYSELLYALEGMNMVDVRGLFDHIAWMRQEGTLSSLVQRLQNHKSSLILMLSIMQCQSMEEAQSSTRQLCALIEQVLESNRDLAERIRGLEREGSIISKAQTQIIQRDDASARSEVTENSTQSNLQPTDRLVKQFAFEDDLQSSRVYNKAIYGYSQASLTSTALHTTALSVFSKLSLSQVSSISFFALPLYAADVHHRELYGFGEEGAVLLDTHTTPQNPTSQKPRRHYRQNRRVSDQYIILPRLEKNEVILVGSAYPNQKRRIS